MPKWVTAEQGTSQWLRSRLGCLTASRMADAMSFTKKGDPTEARKKYQFELMAERMTDVMVERYVTPAMQHGIEYESVARNTYEIITGIMVQSCGFALHDEIEYCGASPDGLIGDDGLIEIKCPSTQNYIEWYLSGEIPEKHKPQMLLQLAVTKRKFVDFIAFDPRIPAHNQIFIKRYEPTQEEITKVQAEAIRFLDEIDLMWELMHHAKD